MNALLGLVPLLGVNTTFAGALLLAATLAPMLCATSLVAWGLRHRLPDDGRALASTALIAGAAALCELLARALAFDSTTRFGWPLLLIASHCLLFAHLDRIWRDRFASLRAMLRAGVQLAAVIAVTAVVVGGIAQFGGDNPLPLVFCIAALLIAGHRYVRGDTTVVGTPRKRVRVTGPVR